MLLTKTVTTEEQRKAVVQEMAAMGFECAEWNNHELPKGTFRLIFTEAKYVQSA